VGRRRRRRRRRRRPILSDGQKSTGQTRIANDLDAAIPLPAGTAKRDGSVDANGDFGPRVITRTVFYIPNEVGQISLAMVCERGILLADTVAVDDVFVRFVLENCSGGSIK